MAHKSNIFGAGGVTLDRTEVSANYQVLASDYFICITAVPSTFTITLPDGADVDPGPVVYIQDESGFPDHTNKKVWIDLNGGSFLRNPGLDPLLYELSDVPFAGIKWEWTGNGWLRL